MPEVMALRPEDRARWGELWQGYLTFYKTALPEARYAETWRRLMAGEGLYGFGAHVDGRLVGITHCLFHASTWADDVCYLQDLFAEEALRGRGIGRALIEAVAGMARARGASRLYWMTQDSNATARLLYDRLASNRGFIRYDYTG